MEPDESDASVDEEPTAVADSAADETAPEYVPMSEWIGDFDSRSALVSRRKYRHPFRECGFRRLTSS